jgi:hypothetical protein
MYRKLLISGIIILAGLTGLKAQSCIPNPLYANEPPGLWPDSLTNLPIAGKETAYEAVINFKNVVDTTSGNLTVKVHAARIHEINGLPAGFTYHPSYGTNTGGWVNPGTAPNLTSGAGCMVIAAPQSAVQAAYNGPGTIHPLTIKIDMRISTLIFGTWTTPTWMSADATFAAQMPVVDRYKIRVSEGHLGLEEFNGNKFEVSQNFPNPFSEATNFSFYSTMPGKVYFKVFNMIGKEVYFEKIAAEQGANNFEFKPLGLPAGAYICTFNNGKETVAKKIMIDRK